MSVIFFAFMLLYTIALAAAFVAIFALARVVRKQRKMLGLSTLVIAELNSVVTSARITLLATNSLLGKLPKMSVPPRSDKGFMQLVEARIGDYERLAMAAKNADQNVRRIVDEMNSINKT